jgi:beta-aspartyl-peptidase (threonine type)
MKRVATAVAVILLMFKPVFSQEMQKFSKIVLAVHGGTGVLPREEMTPELEKQYRDKLAEALEAGYQALQRPNAPGLDGVEAAIKVLEDSPLFNAGKGAVFTADGRNELDASIMDGRKRQGGAVAEVTTLKNPIAAARAVMERSPHVLLVGRGAEQFAAKAGVETVDPGYFRTERRWQELQAWKKQAAQGNAEKQSTASPAARHHEWSTVGAVAVDRGGNLAAGTSTGGMTGKLYGRLGGVPILGAGTYADNETCAISGTGHGEYFIRFAVAYDVAARMRYKRLDVAAAAGEVIDELKTAGGEAGIIVLDAKGNLAMPFNSPGLYRGCVDQQGRVQVFLYRER